MGPSNKALLDLFRADTALREAQAKLDAATRGVRVQRKRAELAEKAHAETHNRLKHARAQQMELDSDLRARDGRIEHLRKQQMEASNHKQFQTFLVEINTQKTDRSKVEEQAVAKLAEVEQLQKQDAEQQSLAAAEHQRADRLQKEIDATTTELRQEIERLEPLRASSAGAVPAAALAMFDKLADNYDGEAMAGVGHIEGRTESYYCTACNMELVVDVYNRLMTRDEVLTCPGCGRILYVPEELTPDKAVRQKKAPKAPRKRAESTTKPRKKGARAQRSTSSTTADIRRIITTAAAEELRAAELEGAPAVEAEVFVKGESEGVYRVRSADGFRRVIGGKLQAEDLEADVAVRQIGGSADLRPVEVSRAGGPEDEGAEREMSPAVVDRDEADTVSAHD
jgi:predicted  nucleic acid-binding Zn-ribbon protein